MQGENTIPKPFDMRYQKRSCTDLLPEKVNKSLAENCFLPVLKVNGPD